VTHDHDLERFLAFVRRELGAREAVVLDEVPRELAAEARDLCCELPDGRFVVARFDVTVTEPASKQRRLEMLASTFGDLAEEGKAGRTSRPPAARSLQEELRSAAARAGAVNALVIDANSPVLWGAARADGLGSEWPVAGGEGEPPDAAPDAARVALVSRAALKRVLAVADLAGLRKGRHVRHVERDGPEAFAAHSFAGIYLLILAFEAPFDELRAERAIIESLPRIEQLVLALPPLDPSPVAGAAVIAMRRRRSR
jgi:hypothetical protein